MLTPLIKTTITLGSNVQLTVIAKFQSKSETLIAKLNMHEMVLSQIFMTDIS